jgi:hypothetical protein
MSSLGENEINMNLEEDIKEENLPKQELDIKVIQDELNTSEDNNTEIELLNDNLNEMLENVSSLISLEK